MELSPAKTFRCLALLVWLLCPHAEAAFQGYQPIETSHPEDRQPQVQWGRDWDDTFEANTARFKAQIEAQTPKGNERTKRLRVREVWLLGAMIQHYNPTGERRIAAYEQIVENLRRLSYDERANYYRQRLAEEFPGHLELAATHLHDILKYPGKLEKDEWVAYAADRLIALNEAGFLPDKHPWVIDAAKARLDARLSDGSLMGAWADLEALRRHLPEGSPLLLAKEAELLFLAGRTRDALERYDALREAEDSEIRYNRNLELLRRYEHVQLYETVFPRRMDLSARWDALRARALAGQAKTVDDLFEGLCGGQNLLDRGDGRQEDTWHAIARYVRGQDAAGAADLRSLQDEQAREALLESPLRGGPQGVMRLFRRYPYAATAHKALLAEGDRALRAGHAGLACRAFQDVLNYSDDAHLRAAAQVGVWVALSQGAGTRQELEAAFAGIPGNAAYPWMGRAETAAQIRRRLLDSLDAPPVQPPARPLAQLRQAPLRLPPSPAWAPGQLYGLFGEVLQSAWCAHGQIVPLGPPTQSGTDDGLLVFGPNLLARYGRDTDRPVWVRSARLDGDWVGGFHQDSDARVILPGPAQPAVDNGKIYCRWGLDRHGGYPDALAAFDLQTGRMLWSTVGDRAWGELQPISEPAAADGRLYVLAVQGDVEVNTPIHLVCLRADTGGVLWTRLLAHQTLGISPERRSSLRGSQVDLACYGSGVTVRGGQVYACTSVGFVARCDARDGLIEWARAYQRAPLRQSLADLARRQGARMVVTPDRVICLPRDSIGAFALSRRDGTLLWDNPFLPSDCVDPVPAPAGEGTAGEVLLLSDAQHVCAAWADTGKALWTRRFADGLLGRPVVRGDCVYVSTHAGCERLSAQTGAVLERVDWRDGFFHDLAVRDDAVVGIGLKSAAGHVPPSTPVDPAAAKAPFRLPLVKNWQLDRAAPRMLVPPAAAGPLEDANAPGQAVLLSTGLMEGLSLGPACSVRWQSLVEPGIEDLIWTRWALLAVYADSLTAYDPADGRVRWRYRPPRSIDRHYVVGPYIAWTDPERSRNVTLASIADGKVLWQRTFGDGLMKGGRVGATTVGWDGKDVLVLLQSVGRRDDQAYLLTCRAADGEVVKTLSVPIQTRGKEAFVHLAYPVGWWFGPDRRIHEFRLDASGPGLTYDTVVPEKVEWSGLVPKEIEPVGPWLRVRFGRQGETAVDRFYIFKRGDPAYALFTLRRGTIRGDRLYDPDSDTLRVIDLPTKKEVLRCQVPDAYSQQAEIGGFQDTPGALHTLAFVRTDRSEPARFRADAFDPKTGEHLGGQVLDLRYRPAVVPFVEWQWGHRPPKIIRPSLSWQGNMLLVTHPGGLRAYSPQPPGAMEPARAAHVAQPAPKPVQIDGSLQEWDAASAWALQGPWGPAGRIAVTHDEEHLYLAAAVGDDDPQPLLGSDQYGGGDCLEVGLETNKARFRFLVGWDEAGRLRVLGVQPEDAPKGLRGAVRYDPAARQTTYELAIPLAEVVQKSGRWRAIRFSAAAWDDSPGRGPLAVGRFGRGILGPDMIADAHEAIYLGGMLHSQESACLAVARQAPDLEASEDFLREYLRIRAQDRPACLKVAADLLRAGAQSPLAERLLVVLDQGMRSGPGPQDDPSAGLVRIAEQAGVPPLVRARYLAATRWYLSLWVYVPKREDFGMVMVQLRDRPQAPSDREGTAAWAHRVFWGYDKQENDGVLHTPSRQRGGHEVGAYGRWVELRAPLIWLDMHDQPIRGVSLIVWGTAHADRLAIGTTGSEQVLIDDALPDGHVTGPCAWDAALAKSGSKSLGYAQASWESKRLDIAPLAQAVSVHLAGPLRTPPAVDERRVVPALKDNIPKLTGTHYGWRFFEALLKLQAGEDRAKQADLYKWYLSASPDSPKAQDVLVQIQRCYQELNLADWAARMDAVVDECKLPLEAAYLYRTRYLYSDKMYVRSWQLVGPLPPPGAKGRTPAIESGPIDLGKEYAGLAGPVRWQPYEGKTPLVDLSKPFPDAKHAVSYAVCWVHSDKAQPAVIEFGVDDAGRVLLNRRLVLSHKGQRSEPRQARTTVSLPAGWSEVLVEVTNTIRRWGFHFELISPDGRGTPPGVKFSITPPGK